MWDSERNLHRYLFLALAVWIVGVIYGSLIPFDYNPRPLDRALQYFLDTPYLQLERGDRADWIANFLLYVPGGFLIREAFFERSTRRATAVLFDVATLLVGCSLALVVEFVQQYFPPRSVSLNDLYAEGIGCAFGLLAWYVFRARLQNLMNSVSRPGRDRVLGLLLVYTIAYLALSLFPYDFVISLPELRDRLASPHVGWLVAEAECSTILVCGTKLGSIIAATAPIGALIALRLWPRRVSAGKLIGIGLGIGILIETLQLLLFSGISSGAPAFARGLGTWVGGRLISYWPQRLAKERWPWRRPAVLLLIAPYLIAVAILSGWFRTEWISWDAAAAKLSTLNFLPFYYFYFTSETAAVKSALAQSMLYVPIGIGTWLWASLRRPNAWLAAAMAGILAIIVESGKLFLGGARPDPTDVIFAMITGALACWVMQWVSAPVERTPRTEAPHRTSRGALGDPRLDTQSPAVPIMTRPTQVLERTRAHTNGQRMMPTIPATLLSGILLTGIALTLVRFPAAPWALAAALAMYFCLLLRFTKLWAFVITALLPALDLAPWSGWLLFNELDLFFLATLAALVWLPGTGERRDFPLAAKVLLFLFASATAASVARGLFPWEAFSPDAFSTFHTHYNALRVGRGVLWGFVLLALMRRTPGIEKQFVAGMVAGLILVGIIVLWEAIVFLGPFRFSADYRVSGSFSAASTAGAQLESYLAAATPFAVFWVLKGGHTQRLLGAFALALTAYSVAATVSRTSYLAEATALGLFAIAWGLSWQKLRIAGGFAGAILLILVATATAYVTSKGTAISSRFQEASSDFDVRAAHWRRVLSMMEPDWGTTLLGMGLGSYPRTFFWKTEPAQRPAIFSFRRDQETTYVELGVGANVYFEQFIELAPRRSYEMRAAVRSTSGKGTLNAAVCEKWILYGGGCITFRPEVDSTKGWQEFTFAFDAGDLGKGPPLARRPIKVALWNGGSSPLDVTRLQVIDADGRNLVLNGDFSRGGDGWYFSADDHFPWNIFNIFLEVVFEQGWVGLILFLALLIYSLLELCRRAMQRDYLAMVHIAALGGFFVPAIFDSVIDEPRMRILLLVMMFLPLLSPIRVYGKRIMVVPDTAPNPANRNSSLRRR